MKVDIKDIIPEEFVLSSVQDRSPEKLSQSYENGIGEGPAVLSFKQKLAKSRDSK